MRINKVENGNVDATLSVDELILISNLMYFYERNPELELSDIKPLHHELAAQVIMARDLCQYDHVDAVSLESVVRHKIAANKNSKLAKYMKALGSKIYEERV